MKKNRLFSVIFSVIFIAMLSLLASCEEENVGGNCPTCDANSPWSKPGETTCYADQQSCEAALGAPCELCN